jgi:hypothetical protein
MDKMTRTFPEKRKENTNIKLELRKKKPCDV